MTENYGKMCRICLKNDGEDTVCDSSYYVKFFIQVLSLKDFNGKLMLCIWCKAALRRAMAVFTLALESEKTLQKLSTHIPIKTESLYSLNYIHNSHIDIPPHLIEYPNSKTENITIELEECTNPLLQLQEDEIPLKRNKKKILKATDIKNDESISILEQELFEKEAAIKKTSRKQFDFNELKFEVEYLNLEEQLKEVESKKLKYKEFKFQCEECGIGFLTSDVFEEHKVRHTEISGQHKCAICSLRFKSQDVLSQHTLAHKRRFKCLLCSSMFRRQSLCVAHRYKCGGYVQPMACGECSKIFSNEYSLKIHSKVHKTEKRYSCEQCDKMFSSKQRLTVHLRSHSGIKPFSCPQCARSFTTQSNLRAHSLVHEHTTQFYCVECHRYYKTAKSLKRHFNESAKHVGLQSNMYSCKECTKEFSTEKSLIYHISTRHTEHRCSQCDKTFSSNSNLNKHIKCIHTAK